MCQTESESKNPNSLELESSKAPAKVHWNPKHPRQSTDLSGSRLVTGSTLEGGLSPMGFCVCICWWMVDVEAQIQATSNSAENPTSPGQIWSRMVSMLGIFTYLHLAILGVYVHDECTSIVGKYTLHRQHGIENRVIYGKSLQNGRAYLL